MGLTFQPGQWVEALVVLRNHIHPGDFPYRVPARVKAVNGPDVLLIFEKPQRLIEASGDMYASTWAWVRHVDCEAL